MIGATPMAGHAFAINADVLKPLCRQSCNGGDRLVGTLRTINDDAVGERHGLDDALNKSLRNRWRGVESAEKLTELVLHLMGVVILPVDIAVDHAFEPTQQGIKNCHD